MFFVISFCILKKIEIFNVYGMYNIDMSYNTQNVDFDNLSESAANAELDALVDDAERNLLIAELHKLQMKNEELQRQVDRNVSVRQMSPAEIDAEMERGKRIYAAYKSDQAKTEYYNKRAEQREKVGYCDPFLMRPTVAFVNTVPTGNTMCSQTNSRTSFTSIHVMGTGMSNVGLGLIGVYGSSR